MAQRPIKATYMRGGTSKGVFFAKPVLPEDVETRDAILRRVIGSPDPYGKQIDGMGGATSSTSKVVIVGKSMREGIDIDYLFGAPAIESGVIDWSGNCGNLTSAVAPFAIHEGLIAVPEDGTAVVRIWQENIGKVIIAHVPMSGGQPVEEGDFQLDGVAFPSAEIVLEFMNPGGGDSGDLFPTGNPVDTIEVPGYSPIQATLINAGNPAIFIHAADVGLSGTELQPDVNNHPALLAKLEDIRAHCTVLMGLAATTEEATTLRPHTPKLAMVAPPKSYCASSGKAIGSNDTDVLIRIMSMGKLHHAITGTGGIAVAVAAQIEGTVVASAMGTIPERQLVIGHPSGVVSVGAKVRNDNGELRVESAVMSRSARRLMEGVVYVPETYAFS